MLSAHSQVSIRPLYGVEEFRKSRSMAGGMTGGFVLLALFLCLMTPAVKTLAPPKTSTTVLLMRVVHSAPTPQPKSVPPDAMRKLLSPESDMTIPVPPVVEQPKAEPQLEATKTRVPEPVKSKPVQKAPSVKKKAPMVRERQKPVPPSAVPPAKVDAPVPASVAASGVPTSVAGTQERPDDRSKVLAVVLEALNRHKRYPKQARRLGAEGTVQLLVTIGAEGKVRACALGKSSGHGVLDAATARLGEKLVGLEVSPHGGKRFQILVPVRYSLKDA